MERLIEQSRQYFKEADLDALLQDIIVLEEWENQSEELEGWFAVANEQGIFAYFCEEEEAFKCRLDYINRILNG